MLNKNTLLRELCFIDSSSTSFLNSVLQTGETTDETTRIEARRQKFISRYIEGWATADMNYIRAATDWHYRFVDPFIGNCSKWTLIEYFQSLQSAFAISKSSMSSAVCFKLFGPIRRKMILQEYVFWREAPSLGLTGVTNIVVGKESVICEKVCYDLNLASELLRQKLPCFRHEVADLYSCDQN